MRELVVKYLSHDISRREFVSGLTKAGLTATAAQFGPGLGRLGQPRPGRRSGAGRASGGGAPRPRRRRALPRRGPVVAGVKSFQGPGGACFAEQLIASGVKYVFGNSASEDAQFYEALVDRPQLKYILTPHEGPGAAMAAGYIKASGEPAIVMQAGGRRHGQRHRADLQRLQGADAARGLFLPHRPVAPRRARRLRGGRATRSRSSSRSPNTPGWRAGPT